MNQTDEREQFRLEAISTLERRIARAQALVERAAATGQDATDVQGEIAEFRKTLDALRTPISDKRT